MICMKLPSGHIERRFAPTALILETLSLAARAGAGRHAEELSSGLDVSIRDAGLLITFVRDAVHRSPLTAWLTSRSSAPQLCSTDDVEVCLVLAAHQCRHSSSGPF